MEDKYRYQSCGILLDEDFYGTNADGNLNQEFCTFCYQSGGFTDHNLTPEDMISMSVDNMVMDLQMSEVEAQSKAHAFIPNLKRWAKVQ